MDRELSLKEALEYIDPSSLDYQEWVGIGMGLKEAGYTSEDWDRWSSGDPKRYHPGECARKWNSFRGAAAPITAGTIVQMAMERGWRPNGGGVELSWDDVIGGREDLVVVNRNWLEGK